ncbi:MAG: hypothetical protein F8N37_09400 [Telmatospirillum sp.]|nr:hypothetical protein [Telmatospirillum sp.]
MWRRVSLTHLLRSSAMQPARLIKLGRCRGRDWISCRHSWRTLTNSKAYSCPRLRGTGPNTSSPVHSQKFLTERSQDRETAPLHSRLHAIAKPAWRMGGQLPSTHACPTNNILFQTWEERALFNSCNASAAVAFVFRHRIDSETLARQIHVPTENILGLAAHESQYGAGRFARDGKNYFSLHAPAPLQTDTMTALEDPDVVVATFSSFYQSGQYFLLRYGGFVKDRPDAKEFAAALVR